AVAHGDVDRRRRRPRLLFEYGEQLVAYGRVRRGNRSDLAGEAGHGVEQVGARDDADDLAVVDDRNALDVAALPNAHELFKRRGGRHRVHLMGHDIADLAAAEPNVLAGQPAGAHEELDPSWPAPAGTGFRATQEVAFGDDAREIAAIVNHGNAADLF